MNRQIITAMGEQSSNAVNPKLSFEERVFARFDVLDLNIRDLESSMRSLEARLQRLDRHPHEKPIVEQVLKEIVETRSELSKRLDRFEAAALKTGADLTEVEDRLD